MATLGSKRRYDDDDDDDKEYTPPPLEKRRRDNVTVEHPDTIRVHLDVVRGYSPTYDVAPETTVDKLLKSYAASRSFDPSTLQAAIFLTSGNQKQNQLKLVSADNTVQDVVEMLHENGYLAFGEGIELIVFEDKSRARATV
ncbi:uncharacterized protein EHS24_002012 [Apiotrichum porosum]|uniref:Uncharacterized protein n=1 Tax=Apiotrichum porosum TaxID=105984 RepID=A0A427XJN9_9TREE|nr:uncharacterized protein EHS24_002012 [Apiotrichum porosum]RSH79080.1 hypothetical protein EHS24_002012 [Apiotrichum porosum]